MGYDISNHPVDTKFIKETLIPAIVSDKPVSDFINQAAHLSVISHRACQWALRTLNLDFKVYDVQREVGTPRIVREPKKTGFWKSLFGKREIEEYELPARSTGLPGFDSDLCLWGRPFFIVSSSVDESLALLNDYMQCKNLDEVDALAKKMLSKLERRKDHVPKDIQDEVIAALDQFYPLYDQLPELDDDEKGEIHLEATKQRIKKELDLYSKAWQLRESDEELETELYDEPIEASELARSIPYGLINLSSQVLPGWMGRGYVWPTALFDQIGVKVSHLFESPSILFEDLVREYPSIEEYFSTSIESNYSLGGYVRPENIPELLDLLQKHERELIFAWDKDNGETGVELDGFSADFWKILEPVTLAKQRGYGFIEAAEIYSGFIGIVN